MNDKNHVFDTASEIASLMNDKEKKMALEDCPNLKFCLETDLRFHKLIDDLSNEECLDLKLKQYSGIDNTDAVAKISQQIILRGKKRLRRIISASISAAAIIVCGIFIAVQKDPDNVRFSQVVNQGARLINDNGTVIQLTDSVMVIERIQPITDKREEMSDKQVDTIPQIQTLEIPRGGRFRVVLSDGTKVWLNADTRLTYTKYFSDRRDVYLTGEAYFEVVHDAKRPFTVHVGNNIVEVLGTRFSITNYKQLPVMATLLEGSVKVESPTSSIVLIPDNQAKIQPDGEISVNIIDAASVTSWITGKYEFTDMQIDVVADLIERLYDVEFTFIEDCVKSRRLTGVIYINENLDYSLSIFERVTGLKFEKESDNKIKIYHK